jgi:hypothetical protein
MSPRSDTLGVTMESLFAKLRQIRRNPAQHFRFYRLAPFDLVLISWLAELQLPHKKTKREENRKKQNFLPKPRPGGQGWEFWPRQAGWVGGRWPASLVDHPCLGGKGCDWPAGDRLPGRPAGWPAG